VALALNRPVRKIMTEQFINIFTGLQRAHGVTYVTTKGADGEKIKGKSFIKREPVTKELWDNHLNGTEPSLGIIPINEENKCKWGCIDIDSYAEFDHKKLINKIKLLNLPLIVFRSKSGGAHIILHTTVFVEAKLLRDKLLSVSAVLGYGGSEVFPKQIELKSKDDTGNFLNLPYFNCKNTMRYAFKEDSTAASLEEFFELYEKNKITPEQLEKLEIKRPQSEFNDGPPCLESLTQSKLDDGRDRVLYQYIQYAKRKWPADWDKKINPFNYKYFTTPLDDKTIQDKIKFNSKKELGFKCNEEPMCSHCDKKLCRTRKFGIGGETVFPILSDLQKILLDKPYYYVNVDGERVKLENATTLYDQRLFQISVLEQADKILPSISKKEYKKYVQTLLDGKETIDPPEGSSKIDQLGDHLEEFCTNRSSDTTVKEDIVRGNVYTNQGKHYFIFSKFYHGFLQKRKWDEKSQVTQQMLKEHFNFKDERWTISKKKITVMSIKSFEKIPDNYKPKQFKPKEPY